MSGARKDILNKISLFDEARAILQRYSTHQEHLIDEKQLDHIRTLLSNPGRVFLFKAGIASIIEEISSADWINALNHDSILAARISETLVRFNYWLQQPHNGRETLEQSLCARRAINLSAKHDIDPSSMAAVNVLRKQFNHQLPPARGGYCTIKTASWKNTSRTRINQFWRQYAHFWESESWSTQSERYKRNRLNRDRASARGVTCSVEYTATGKETIINQSVITVDGAIITGKQASKQSGLTAVNNFLLADARSYVPAQRLINVFEKLIPATMTNDQLASVIVVYLQVYEMLGFEQICKIAIGNNPSLVGYVQLNQGMLTRVIGSSFTRMGEKIFDSGFLPTELIPEVIPFIHESLLRQPKIRLIEDFFSGNPVDQYRACLSEWLDCPRNEIIWRTGALSEALIYHCAIMKPIAQSAQINLLSQNFFFGARAISSYYSIQTQSIAHLLADFQNSFRRVSGLRTHNAALSSSSNLIGSASEDYESIMLSITDMSQNPDPVVKQLSFTKFIQALGNRNRLTHYCPSHYCSQELNSLRLNDKQVNGKYIARYPAFASVYGEFAQLSANDKTHQLAYDGMPWNEFVNQNPHYRSLLSGQHLNNQRRSFITMLVNNHVGDFPRGTLTGQGPLLLKPFGIRTIQPPDRLQGMLAVGLADLETKYNLPDIAKSVCQSVDLSRTLPDGKTSDNADDYEGLRDSDRLSFISNELTPTEVIFEKQIEDALKKHSFKSPRINLLFNLSWHLNLPWRNLMRNQAYYSLLSFITVNQSPDTYFTVAFRQYDKGGIGVYPLTIPQLKLYPLILRVKTYHKHHLEWKLCGKADRLTASTTIEHLQELLPQSTLLPSELYRVFLRVTLRRCFRSYNGYFASTLAGLNYRTSLNYVSIEDILRFQLKGEVNLVNINGDKWANTLSPAATRANKSKPRTQSTPRRNLNYSFRGLAFRTGIFGDPSTWSNQQMITFFVKHYSYITKPDALRMVTKEQIHKLSTTKVPQRFVDAFWPDVITGRKSLIPVTSPSKAKVTSVEYQKMTISEKAKYFASFIASPSESEIEGVLKDLNLINSTVDRILWAEARRVYARMYTDGWCTLSKPVRLFSKIEMKQIEELLFERITSKLTNLALKQELITFYDLALLTGARPDEILSLRLSHIDISAGSIGLFIVKGKTDNAKRVIILRPLMGFEDNYQRLNDYLRGSKVKSHEPFTALRKAHQGNLTKNTREYMNRNLTEAVESFPQFTAPDKNSFSIYSLRHLNAFYRLQECVDLHYWNGNFHPALACEADQLGHGNFDTTVNSYVGTGLNLITFPEPKFG